jgi:DNA polymerase-3 subunit epsilon/ATP-dependent DNA helicase DinG
MPDPNPSAFIRVYPRPVIFVVQFLCPHERGSRNGTHVPRAYIALDLETTGLNATRDAIIEIGVVRFVDGEPVETFATLINPGRPIPSEITLLTGITDRDVLGKPRVEQVVGQVGRFVGSLPVVAHNVGFDLAFLRAQQLLHDNIGLDTWELATILLPNLPSYNLGSLAARFDIPIPTAHRAEYDAQATGLLFAHLCRAAADLPRPALTEINRLTRHSEWPLAVVFREAAESRGIATVPQREPTLELIAPGSPVLQPLEYAEPLAPPEGDRVQPVDTAALAGMLRPGGAVSRAFPGYEFRPPQVHMLEAVAAAFNQGHHLMAEAGTGTGKSLAYLLPAIAFAVKNDTRVVVSTNTINLQDQLYQKDLPDLQGVLAAEWGRNPPFRAALLKGRSNYLCPRRFLGLLARPTLSQDELRGAARLLVWLPRTQTGDQGELSLPQPSDRFVWSQVAADSAGCSMERCQREMGGRCFLYRARRQAEAAHILVVNHALLMADAATENRVLPEYRHLILDEAHHLEDAVTDQLSFRADSQTLSQLFTALHPQGGAVVSRGGRTSGNDTPTRRDAGLLADVLAMLRTPRIPAEHYAIVQDHILRLQADIEGIYLRLDDFWQIASDAFRDMEGAPREQGGDYDLRLRIIEATRSQPVWVDIEIAWENLGALWQTMTKRLENLRGGLGELMEAGFSPIGLETLAEELEIVGRGLGELYAQMEAWVMRPASNAVYWVEIGSEDRRARRISLRAAPLNVGPLVQEHVFFRNETVILTSATLRAAGSFDYMRDRLQAQEADTATVGSPFDYKGSTLLCLPSDVPEPNAPGYQTAVEQAIIGLARAMQGRTLVLFTSNAQMKRTAQAITAALTEVGITTLMQGSGGSRHQLLESFRSSQRTVLLGTRSFWEGVDVVGPALSALVLVRLPFAVPNDPIIAARSETFDDPFYNYQVPDAILRFRQGFGRLIRSKTDRGVVLVLDKRVTSKRYGQLFLESLPECTHFRGALKDVPAQAQAWVDGRPAND